jgi:CheY-like chemotaxis protein
MSMSDRSVANGNAARTVEPAPRGTENSRPSPRVAIVDDEPAFAAYLRTFLALRGYEARCYTRGDELLAAMRGGETADVVLLDVMMPGLDGLETLRALKAAHPGMQAIMLSGRQQASVIVEAVKAGATDYVVKPDDPEGLGEIALDVAIKNAIEKNRLVSELTELRQQLSDDQDRAFLFWGEGQDMRTISTVVARDPPALPQAESRHGESELRGVAGRVARERAVRARAGRLHRRGEPADREVRAGRRFYAAAR